MSSTDHFYKILIIVKWLIWICLTHFFEKLVAKFFKISLNIVKMVIWICLAQKLTLKHSINHTQLYVIWIYFSTNRVSENTNICMLVIEYRIAFLQFWSYFYGIFRPFLWHSLYSLCKIFANSMALYPYLYIIYRLFSVRIAYFIKKMLASNDIFNVFNVV